MDHDKAERTQSHSNGVSIMGETVIRKIVVTTLLISLSIHPYPSALKIRPQGLSGVRKAAGAIPGINTHIYTPDEQQWPQYDSMLLGTFPNTLFNNQKLYPFISATITTEHALRSHALAKNIFGNTVKKTEQGSTIIIQGSKRAQRDDRAWLADYFYLPDRYDGALIINPRMNTAIIDFSFYLNGSRFIPGLYCAIYVPFVHTRWGLNMKEIVNSPAHTGRMQAGRFSPDTIDSALLLSRASQFFAGIAPERFVQPGITEPNNNGLYTIIRNPLMTQKIPFESTRVSGLSEIRTEVGFDGYQRDNAHVGIYSTFAIPIGSKPTNTLLFSPYIGNGKHWEIGAGITGHWTFWKDIHEQKQWSICMDAQVTHLCKATQCRTFDLKNNPMSRYMLAAKHVALQQPGGSHNLSGSSKPSENVGPQCQDFDNDSLTLADIGAMAAGGNETLPVHYQATGEYVPVGNLTTQNVDVHINAQADATVWLNYCNDALSVDIGYSLWLQTKDQIALRRTSQEYDQHRWALHGQAELFGYFDENPDSAIALAASESTATIYQGTSSVTGTPNAAIDNGLYASASRDGVAPVGPLWSLSPRAPTLQQTKLSRDPVFITHDTIDFNPTVSALSHTLFTAIGYNRHYDSVSLYIGVGGNIEIGSSDSTLSCNRRCEKTYNNAISQWAVWLKCGLTCN